MNQTIASQAQDRIAALFSLIPMLLAALPAVTYAADALPADPPATAGLPPPYYVQGNLGRSYQRSHGNTAGLDICGCDPQVAYKLIAGRQLDAHWGVELSYADLRKATIHSPAGDANYDTQLFALSGAYRYPFDDRYAATVRAGIGYTHSTLRIAGIGYEDSSRRFPLVLGAALSYALTNQWDLTADYDYYGKVGRYRQGGYVTGSLLSAGLRYKF